ncbi:MAG: HAD hydrolase-like protein [Natronomonas sp.]
MLEAIDRLGADPRNVIFVGDGERDERTADRAGVDFSYVDAFLRA